MNSPVPDTPGIGEIQKWDPEGEVTPITPDNFNALWEDPTEEEQRVSLGDLLHHADRGGGGAGSGEDVDEDSDDDKYSPWNAQQPTKKQKNDEQGPNFCRDTPERV